jgi:hypothetical protein
MKKPHITVLPIGVDDLDAAVRFYQLESRLPPLPRGALASSAAEPND